MEFCILHKTVRFSMFCTSCEQHLCLECAKSHSVATDCSVIPLEKISEEIKRSAQNFATTVDSVDKCIETMSRKCGEEKQRLVEDFRFIKVQIEKDYGRNCKELKHERSTLMEKVIQTEMTNMERVINVRRHSRKVRKAIENLEQDLNGSFFQDEISELQKMREIENLAGGISEKLKEIEKECMQIPSEIFLSKVFNNGAFGMLSLSTLIGGVIISPDQLVHVFDSRQQNGGVCFICIDNKDKKREFWRYLLKIGNPISFPVAMSSKSIFCDKQQILIAVGKTVYSLRPHFNKGSYNGVASLKSILLDDLKESEWITSITSHQPSFDPSYEFLVSVNDSNLLREYNVSGEVLRRIKLTDSVSSIPCVAYVYNMFGVIHQNRDDVKLYTSGNTLEPCGFLKAPPCSNCRLIPKVVLWTGFRWLVLWVSEGQEKEWKVVRYIATGEQMDVCDKGISKNTFEVPVNITRSRNSGYVSFGDGTFRTFQY